MPDLVATPDLLTTKFNVPPIRPALVPRPRLIEKLMSGLSGEFTLLSAPAGFGKTTLLSEWASQIESPLAWISLDESDNDPSRFLAYLIAALEPIYPDSNLEDITRAMGQSPQALPLISIMTAVINELALTARPALLVLDDYHLITVPTVHELVGFWLDHAPDGIHLVISSRTDPPLPLARLRARGQMTEIRGDDLTFTREEMEIFLDVVMGLTIGTEDLSRLEKRTEGWIAGIQLAALSLRGQADPSAFIASLSGANRYIVDYLAEEVVGSLPQDIQSFLLDTSILDRICGSLGDAITGRTGSQQVLECLERDNLFLIPLDTDRHWFRYHQLFSGYLRDRLQVLEPEKIPWLHHRAAGWFASQGATDEAVGHALAGGDYDRAAALIEDRARGLIIRGQAASLGRWLEALPDESIMARAELCLAYTWAVAISGRGSWDASKPYIDRATEILGVRSRDVIATLSESDPSSTEARSLSDLAQIQAFITRNAGDFDRAIDLFRATLEYGNSAGDLWIQTISAGGLGSLYCRQGDVRAAEEAFLAAAEAGQALNSLFAVVLTTTMVGQMRAIQGQLHRAADTYRRAINQVADRRERPLPLSALAAVYLADILREQNDLAAAHHTLDQGMTMGRQINDFDALTSGYILAARLAAGEGNADGALAILGEGTSIARQVGYDDYINWADAWRSRIWLDRGDERAAVRWAKRRGLTGIHPEQTSQFDDLEVLTYCRLLFSKGEAGAAMPLIETRLARAENDGRGKDLLEILVLQVLGYQALGRRDDALRILARALLMAEPEGYVRLFIDEGPVMAAMLRAAGAAGHSPSYVNLLLSTAGEMTPSRVLLDPLSERELEVLSLIADGLTNAQIADGLTIALSTVKTHINRIYSKLDVRTRAQAVAKARELRLI